MVVANHIRSIVDQENILSRSSDERNQLGEWGLGDQCQLWYDTGANVVPHSSNLVLQAFGDDDKYALEVPNDGGSITVHNPFDQDRMLYLTYMTTSAGSQPHKVYPKLQVQIGETELASGVVLDPYHDDNEERRHVTRTTAVGKLPAHSTTQIQLLPMQETLAPFRLVGASLLAKEKASLIATEFELETEKVHMGRLYRELDLW